jgi:putative endonuclease
MDVWGRKQELSYCYLSIRKTNVNNAEHTLKGYTILTRRFVVSGGEIDLVARRGGSIAFVEVKARADLEVAAIAISATKRRRIARAARVWLMRNSWAAGLTLRGDAVFVARGRLPRHQPDAYRLEID